MNASTNNKQYLTSLPTILSIGLQNLKIMYGGSFELRFSFILYRDQATVKENEKLEFCNYNENIESFLKSISIEDNVKCNNFMSGIHALESLSWEASPEKSTRILFHLCDSRCNKLNQEEAKTLKFFKKMKINYFFGFTDTKDRLDAMINQFNDTFDQFSYRRMDTFEVKGISSFLKSLLKSIYQSISKNKKYLMKNPRNSLTEFNEKPVDPSCIISGSTKFDEVDAELEIITIDDSSFQKFFQVKGNIENYVNKQKKKVKISKSKSPFSRGGSREAYIVYLQERKLQCVAKKYMYKLQRYNKYEYLLKMVCTQAVSQFLAKKFEKEVNLSEKSIQFLNLVILKINNKYYTLEKYIDVNDFKKWDNNFLKLNENLEIEVNNNQDVVFSSTLNAFTHWTYYKGSPEFLLVDDLQGLELKEKEFILTDPVVHCKNQDQFDIITNLGEEGIESFFKSHICSNFCIQYELPFHPKQPKGLIAQSKLKGERRKYSFEDYDYSSLTSFNYGVKIKSYSCTLI